MQRKPTPQRRRSTADNACPIRRAAEEAYAAAASTRGGIVQPIAPEQPGIVQPIAPEQPGIVQPIAPEQPGIVQPIAPEQPGITLPIGELPGYGGQLGMGNCLGRRSLRYAPQILNFIHAELNLRQAYLMLARRNSRWAATLNQLAAESMANARRLAAAHFLITGNYYWPSSLPGTTSQGTPIVELRRLFSVAQENESKYREVAGQITDRCLAALYNILADNRVAQIGQMLSLLQLI